MAMFVDNSTTVVYLHSWEELALLSSLRLRNESSVGRISLGCSRDPVHHEEEQCLSRLIVQT